MAWEHYSRCYDWKWGSNFVHNQTFRCKKQIQTQNGSRTLYTIPWRRDSNILSPNKENSGQRLAWQYGRSCCGKPECWTHRTSSAKKTKIHSLHTKRAQIRIPTTKGSGVFDGTAKCKLERILNPFNQQRRILSSLYYLSKRRRTE